MTFHQVLKPFDCSVTASEDSMRQGFVPTRRCRAGHWLALPTTCGIICKTAKVRLWVTECLFYVSYPLLFPWCQRRSKYIWTTGFPLSNLSSSTLLRYSLRSVGQPISAMVPAFGFSVGDFVNAISLINKVRKALRDTDGADDDLRIVLQELEQLELVLSLLGQDNWGRNYDTSHVNAVRGMALTCQVPLQDFLRKLESFKRTVSKPGNLKLLFQSNARKVHWALSMKDEANSFRAIITSKIVAITLLMVMPVR